MMMGRRRTTTTRRTRSLKLALRRLTTAVPKKQRNATIRDGEQNEDYIKDDVGEEEEGEGDEEPQDCPICLDPMQPEDSDHVLQCRRRCGYNFCHECIESLIVSSKDDYAEASDGNRHVKVFLRCPNCRSDLSPTIRDTLLLRKADIVVRLTKRPSARHQAAGKELLTESQWRLLNVLHTKEVQDAIKRARKAEREYLGRVLSPSLRSSTALVLDTSSFGGISESHDEDWGVEADIVFGPHDSFHLPRQPPPPPSTPVSRAEALQVDPSLFAGLDSFLDDEQRRSITAQMTSGDSDQLAQAALQLYRVLHYTTLTVGAPSSTQCDPISSRSVSRASVFQLIAESQEAHEKEEKKTEEGGAGGLTTIPDALPPPPSRTTASLALQMQLIQDAKLQAAFQKRFPVPVRMPKAVEIDASYLANGAMSFLDYGWDGTVADAYSKISIGYIGNLVWQKRPTNNAGVRRILGNGNGDVRVELPGKVSRILLLDAGPAGRQGAHRGDVVTHVDGVPIAKGLSARDVERLLRQQTEDRKVILTLNAERPVAEALKRRAMAIADEL